MSNVRVPPLNQFAVAGRLVRDAELKFTRNQKPYCKGAVCNEKVWKDKAGDKQTQTAFIDYTVWGDGAEWAAKMKKGEPVIITGFIIQEDWEDKATGQKRSKLSINVQTITPLSWPDDSAPKQQDAQPAPPASTTTAPDESDDIPF